MDNCLSSFWENDRRGFLWPSVYRKAKQMDISPSNSFRITRFKCALHRDVKVFPSAVKIPDAPTNHRARCLKCAAYKRWQPARIQSCNRSSGALCVSGERERVPPENSRPEILRNRGHLADLNYFAEAPLTEQIERAFVRHAGHPLERTLYGDINNLRVSRCELASRSIADLVRVWRTGQ